MSVPVATSAADNRPVFVLPRWATFLLVAGLYLTFRGYHAFDGDQAYRLPILLRVQDPTLYETDPFVRAFDAFNPHRGYLALLDLASRPFGLATALAGVFAFTLVATAIGIDRLAHSVWPGSGVGVGMVALILVLMAKAGNLGTNHLFEATLLDRLIGFALGWLAIASAVGNPARGVWRSAPWIGLATLVHPSVGLQIGLTLVAAWITWAILPVRSGVGWRTAAGAVGCLGLALAPGVALMMGQGGQLFRGLPEAEFRLWTVMVQGPQHMLPSTWRGPQWWAWACYPALACLSIGRSGVPWPAARVRLAFLMGVNLASLGLAYLAVEGFGDLRATVFQPFRMATLARGLALVAVSGRVSWLWGRGDPIGQARAVLIGVGLSLDGAMVVASAVEVAMSLGDWVEARWACRRRWAAAPGLVVLAAGLTYLARHDPESGHVPLLAGLGTSVAFSIANTRFRPAWNLRRALLSVAAAWVLPIAAAVVPVVVADPSGTRWATAMVARWRFAEVPTDPVERLAVWSRANTPASAMFIGPPGPKTFRLWSRRPLAFNRGGSPYHAEGLADWSNRYRDHVGFRGSATDFARAYLAGRHALESRYEAMTDSDRAGLARRQGATHVLAAAPGRGGIAIGGPLEWLRTEGPYAVYRVRPNFSESARPNDLQTVDMAPE